MSKIHTKRCLDEECPLKKFIKNDGNFNIQKQCLLNYMTTYFNKAMKNFPYNKLLRLYYIHFNYRKKYNLNSVRANLEYIKKLKNNIKDEFIIYCLEKEILNMKNKSLNYSEGNEIEQENIILQNNYKNLKDLIINSTKLYAEFWGIFANNISNNINISKLYKLGENLNKYLKEINDLWENNLKNKKISVENEYIVQLYSRFLKEILWDKKSSEEDKKKINEEYHIQGFNKKSKKSNNIDNILANIIENPDCLFFVNSNEKGKCKIFQFSNSLSHLIGYQRQELINRPLESLMPSIFIDGHSKKVEDFIKSSHLNNNSEKESFRGLEKKKTFILIKSKVGYLIPFNARFTVFDDNDFSNNFIIRAILEQCDAKSMYAYYILTKNDFCVECISSSSIHLGFSMDLLKKYVIKLNILIRTNKDLNFNLFDKYHLYEEEPRKITWVYPDVIYPKNDMLKNKDKQIEDLIKISRKKKLNLQIIEMKYKEGEILGFIFKFSEIHKNNKNKNDILLKDLTPSYRNEILFDLLNLNYIRATIVNKKSGLRNLREEAERIESQKILNNKLNNKENKNNNKSYYELSEESSGDAYTEILLTKEKILELQARNSGGIESFINLLDFYGKDVALVKQRPNKEQYIAGKIREPLIRISVNNFVKRIEERIKLSPSLYNNIKKTKNKSRESFMKNDKKNRRSLISFTKNNKINKNKENDEINKDSNGDYIITLANIFNDKNINTIKLVDLIIYILTISILIIEYCLTNLNINTNKQKFLYLDNSYKIIYNILYTKYFLTEAIATNTIDNYMISEKIGKIHYLNYIKKELTNYHQEFIDLFDSFIVLKVKFSKNFTDFISYKNITAITVNNGIQNIESQPFNTIMNKLTTSIYYISTISDLEKIDMNNKYSYELMINLINVYYISWTEASKLLLEDINSFVKNPGLYGKLILILSLIITILSIFSFYIIMNKLVLDRERPISLFLTIKKNLFEYLKISTENFSNKLLNKFLGNEENEEESQQDYIISIKSNDINIAKFKELYDNKNKKVYKKGRTLISCLAQLIIFFILYEFYIIIKFINYQNYFSEVYEFNKVFNYTHFSHIFVVIKINIFKQFFFNNTLPIYYLDKELISDEFYKSFFHLSTQFAITILETSKVDNFLKNEYKNLYKENLYNDFSEFIDIYNIKNNSYFNERIENGYKSVVMEIYEILRCLNIQYNLNNNNINNNINDEITSPLINNQKWYEVHQLLITIIKEWNKNIIDNLNSSFYSLTENLQAIYLSFSIVIIVLITLSYCIIWKSYEERFHNVLKKSFDLINLIPKEIKTVIVSKLNE